MLRIKSRLVICTINALPTVLSIQPHPTPRFVRANLISLPKDRGPLGSPVQVAPRLSLLSFLPPLGLRWHLPFWWMTAT